MNTHDRGDHVGRGERRPYHVWRRSDGYVSATVGPPSNGRDTFDTLLVTYEWANARELIERERSNG